MYSIKVIGAGSIGNHLSHAARMLDWSVDLCDVDSAALNRTRNEIYPGRYGSWDETIRLYRTEEAPSGGYDLICVGTPPDVHVPLALAAIAEKPRAVLVEKPFCAPDLQGAQEVADAAEAAGVKIFTGYDHVVGAASCRMVEVATSGRLGEVTTLDVEFREYWGGIFAAHPWLDGPADTYLGYWRRGGGASGEHSHAANLWQHFAHAVGAGRVVEVQASMDFVEDGTVDYDRLCLLNLRTEHGLVGRVVQDVVTSPPRKWARMQGTEGFVEWHCGYKSGCDAVLHAAKGAEVDTEKFEKTRPDDFIRELKYISSVIDGSSGGDDLSLARGLDTMLVVAAAHEAAQRKCAITIDYDAGWTPAALRTA